MMADDRKKDLVLADTPWAKTVQDLVKVADAYELTPPPVERNKLRKTGRFPNAKNGAVGRLRKG